MQMFLKGNIRWNFAIKAKMYDVIRVKDLGDTTIYICIHDVKESGLFQVLDRMVHDELNKNEGQKKQREMILGFFQKLYLPVPELQIGHSATDSDVTFVYLAFVSEKYISEVGEPPQFMFLT